MESVERKKTMAKAFFDVFPSLTVSKDMKEVFEEVQVEKVTSTKSKDLIRVYIFHNRLIPKNQIFFIEKETSRQLFPSAPIQIKIYEHYKLSNQYTPEKFFHIYKDSIALELKTYNPVIYQLYKHADILFSEERTILFTMPSHQVAKRFSEEQ